MTRYEVSFLSYTSAAEQSTLVDANYYRHIDGWIAFKTEDHKIVEEIREDQVKSIRKVERPNIIITVDGPLDPKATADAVMQRVRRYNDDATKRP